MSKTKNQASKKSKSTISLNVSTADYVYTLPPSIEIDTNSLRMELSSFKESFIAKNFSIENILSAGAFAFFCITQDFKDFYSVPAVSLKTLAFVFLSIHILLTILKPLYNKNFGKHKNVPTDDTMVDLIISKCRKNKNK